MIPHSRPTTGDQEATAASAVVHSGHLAQGSEVAAFEEEIAQRLGCRQAVAVSSGTAALMLTLRTLGVEGESVLMPSYVCSALLHAAHQAEAKAALTDVDARDGNLQLSTTMGPSGQTVLVPHMFGHPASMDSPAFERLRVVEDLAMALGTKGVGRTGIASVCSFYATKMITSGGEGGMVVTDEESVAEEIRGLREYDGRDPKMLRWSAKLTDVGAAIGRIQLRRLDEFVDRRQVLASRYRQLLQDSGLLMPPQTEGANDYRFVVGLPDGLSIEDALAHMLDAGVICHRPIDKPLHRWLEMDDEQFPTTTALWESSMSIPIYPTLTLQQQDVVCHALNMLTQGDAIHE